MSDPEAVVSGRIEKMRQWYDHFRYQAVCPEILRYVFCTELCGNNLSAAAIEANSDYSGPDRVLALRGPRGTPPIG
jgi:hypothetical protein